MAVGRQGRRACCRVRVGESRGGGGLREREVYTFSSHTGLMQVLPGQPHKRVSVIV